MNLNRMKELAGLGHEADLMEQLKQNIEEMERLEEAVDVEGVSIEDLQRMMDGAKRGLGLTNKLKDPEYKKQHLSRIMGNMNRIRGAIARLIKQMDVQEIA